MKTAGICWVSGAWKPVVAERDALSELIITGSGLNWTASCPDTGKSAAFRVEMLTDEGLRIGKRFTGAALGLAAFGRGEAVFLNYEEEMHDE